MIPSAPRFSRVLHQRRAEAKGASRLLRQLVGLEAKLKQYEQGERFIEAVEAESGSLLDNVWRGAEWLPDLAEIREPRRWVERVRAATAVAG